MLTRHVYINHTWIHCVRNPLWVSDCMHVYTLHVHVLDLIGSLLIHSGAVYNIYNDYGTVYCIVCIDTWEGHVATPMLRELTGCPAKTASSTKYCYSHISVCMIWALSTCVTCSTAIRASTETSVCWQDILLRRPVVPSCIGECVFSYNMLL